MNEEQGVKQMKVKIPQLKDFYWLSEKELEIVRTTLKHLNIEAELKNKILSSNALNIKGYFEDEATTTITLQNIQISEKTRIEVVSSPNDISLFGVKVFHLEQKKMGKTYIKFVSNLGGEIIEENRQEYIGNELDNPDLLDIYKELNNNEEDSISVNAWYSNIPCLYNGCCVIKEPLYPGAAPTIPVSYKWCGAKCGSGTPVNSVDTCCRAHDKCYATKKSYPGRCSCDRNLISCLSKKGFRAAGIISGAFKLKMLGRC